MRTAWRPCPSPATVTCESPRGTHVSGTNSTRSATASFSPAVSGSVCISRQACTISAMLGAVESMVKAMKASALASGAGSARSMAVSRSTSVGRT